MGKVDHFRNRLEPFADLGSRHCTFCQHRTLVSLHCRTQCMPLYGHSWFHSQRRRDGPAFPIYYFSMTSPRYSSLVSSLTLHLQYTVDNAHSSIKFRFMCNVKTFRFCIIYWIQNFNLLMGYIQYCHALTSGSCGYGLLQMYTLAFLVFVVLNIFT